ncbi:MAG TPA: hypothetical protein VEJ23_03050 [Solirubrobacteraceae bacterium]|nr:hypothetical protein [Solirubrobacteraceae bacterium]
MSDQWKRLAPLTGVLFTLLIVVAIITSNGETPKPSASPAKVVLYYASHRSEVETSGILFALAFLVLVLFAGALRSYLRPAAEGLGALVLAGSVLMAVGALTGGGLEYGIAHNLHDLTPEMAKTLNFVSNELFLPLVAGAFIFGVCSGLAILRGAPLPNWLGVVAILIGIVSLVPPAGMGALFAFVIWTVVVAVLMYMRSGKAADTAGATGAAGEPLGSTT